MPATTPGTASGPSSSVFRAVPPRGRPRTRAKAAAVPSGTPTSVASSATCRLDRKPRANSCRCQALAYQSRVRPGGGKDTISCPNTLMTMTATTGARMSAKAAATANANRLRRSRVRCSTVPPRSLQRGWQRVNAACRQSGRSAQWCHRDRGRHQAAIAPPPSSARTRQPERRPSALDIVITNDDGYTAPGLQALYDALVGAGHDVHIAAPQANQSAQGSSLVGPAALGKAFAVTELSPGNYYVDGRPVAATLVGLDVLGLFEGGAPDIVISGTNRDENIGRSDNISGTVNAAVAALHRGIPAIAFSAGAFEGSYDAAYANAAEFLVGLLDLLQAEQAKCAPLLPTGEGLNLNFPGNPDLDGPAVNSRRPGDERQLPDRAEGERALRTRASFPTPTPPAA